MVSLVKRRIVTDTSKIERTQRPESFRLWKMFLIILSYVSTQQRGIFERERREILKLCVKELKIENKMGNNNIYDMCHAITCSDVM